MSMKKSSNTIGNRTRNLPTCSPVPQPTAPPAACPSFLVINVRNQGKALCSPCISNKKQCHSVYFIWKLLYMFRVVTSTIIRSANNYIYSIWYLSHRYYYQPLSWKSWNWFECAVGGVAGADSTLTSGLRSVRHT